MDASGITIQDASDHPDLIPVFARWLKAAFAPNRRHVTEATYQARLTAPPDPASGLPRAWFALASSEPVGCARLVAADHADRPDLTPWLASVFVAPDWRRRGIASALVQTVQAATQASGFPALYLYTPDQARLYARQGFTVIGGVISPEDARACDLMVWTPPAPRGGPGGT